MRSFYEKESVCSQVFAGLGECYHLWTPENFEIIFSSEEDFKVAMCIVGICAMLFPEVKLLTFQIMSNHLHITAAGAEDRIKALFARIKKMLRKYALSSGKSIDWDRFEAKTRKLESLEDVRNVIVYNNRNGFIVSPEYSPFTYPWGANRFYFNPDAKILAQNNSRNMSFREKRFVSHSHIADEINNLFCYDGYALPISFCDVSAGERLFRDASHYFYKISKNIESNKMIAKEIGENVFYTDDELFAVISAKCKKEYDEPIPSRIGAMEKIRIAKMMRFDFNASDKQIQRMLKLERNTISSFLGAKPSADAPI